jgi:hypothetical protein
MRRRVTVWRFIATTDVPTTAANPQVKPAAADLQALFAAPGAGMDCADRVEMGAALAHGVFLLLSDLVAGTGLRRAEINA